MQSDEVIWQIINHQFCSFKTKIARERTFCQNPYNVTGLCIRSACPLANSRYATIREEEGVCYLFIKTIERAHTPKNLWEKIRLPANYTKALDIVSEHLEYFPKYLVHRNKQRLTKIHQMIIRMRKLKLKAKPKIVTINTKVEKREKGKERKALQAAQLERAIEKELLERLKQVSEGEIYNYPERQFNKALTKAAAAESGEEEDVEGEDEIEDGDELEEEEERDYDIEYVEDFDASDDEGGRDEAEMTAEEMAELYSNILDTKRKRSQQQTESSSGTKKSARKANARVEIEYEDEEEERPVASRAASTSMSSTGRGRNITASDDVDYNF